MKDIKTWHKYKKKYANLFKKKIKIVLKFNKLFHLKKKKKKKKKIFHMSVFTGLILTMSTWFTQEALVWRLIRFILLKSTRGKKTLKLASSRHIKLIFHSIQSFLYTNLSLTVTKSSYVNVFNEQIILVHLLNWTSSWFKSLYLWGLTMAYYLSKGSPDESFGEFHQTSHWNESKTTIRTEE